MTTRPPTEPIFAFLITEAGPVQTCLGCSALLAEKGMLRAVMEQPLAFISERPVIDGVEGVFSSIYYAVADDHTLADCRKVIRDRHVGQPWGS